MLEMRLIEDGNNTETLVSINLSVSSAQISIVMVPERRVIEKSSVNYGLRMGMPMQCIESVPLSL